MYMDSEYILDHFTDFYETGFAHHCIRLTLVILQFRIIRNPSVTPVRLFVQGLQALRVKSQKTSSESCVIPQRFRLAPSKGTS